MAIKNSYFHITTLTLFIFITHSQASTHFPTTQSPLESGHWSLLQPTIGISAMHVQLLYTNQLIIFDRTTAGHSNITLPNHLCLNTTSLDCTAHSVIYDLLSNTFRPLFLASDTFCSSGAVDHTGTLVQTGGFGSGEKMVRKFPPCNYYYNTNVNNSAWTEHVEHKLAQRRWYASNQILPDGRVIILGGRNVFTYEFFPGKNSNKTSFYLRFLAETRDPFEENNLYPFLHLLPDGRLFVFANKRSVLLDYKRNKVVKEFPVMPGDDKRNYPSTGSSVLLPIRLDRQELIAEVMVCGGAPSGAFVKAMKRRVFVAASRTCGRIRVTDSDPEWDMEEMPMPRVMSDMVILPGGDVLIVNGAENGTAGWENAVNPVLNPVLYRVNEVDPNRRFLVLSSGLVPRMYHSTAVLLPDGRVLIGGSNPHVRYNFTAQYPTELSLEVFYPPYLEPQFTALRPNIIAVETMGDTLSYDGVFAITLGLTAFQPGNGIHVELVMPSFNTHSVSMNQRMVVLETVNVVQLSTFNYKITVVGPISANVAPPGFYMMFVVHSGVPSIAVWVKVR